MRVRFEVTSLRYQLTLSWLSLLLFEGLRLNDRANTVPCVINPVAHCMQHLLDFLSSDRFFFLTKRNANWLATVKVLNCEQDRVGQGVNMRKPNRNHSFPAAAIGILVLCFGCVVTCGKAQADLYTTNAASLEWKVDSADEVFLAELIRDADANFGSRFKILETLKANHELSTFPGETVHRCQYSMEMKDQADNAYLAAKGGTIFGAGTWTVHGGFLNLRKNRRVEGRWHRGRSWMRHGEDDLPLGRIVSESDTEFQLADGTKFVRHNEPVTAYDHPHDHPWYLISKDWGLHRVWTTVQVTFAEPGQPEPKALNDWVLMWRQRGSPPIQGPHRPNMPRNVRTLLGDQGFEPRITVLRAGDTFEIEATGARPIGDHNINLAWFNNGQRGFTPRLEPPLIYQETVARGEPTLMHIECNIHDEEHGYLAITEHENVAMTNKDGFANLSDWPIGKQRLTLIHPDYDFRDAEVWAVDDC